MDNYRIAIETVVLWFDYTSICSAGKTPFKISNQYFIYRSNTLHFPAKRSHEVGQKLSAKSKAQGGKVSTGQCVRYAGEDRAIMFCFVSRVATAIFR